MYDLNPGGLRSQASIEDIEYSQDSVMTWWKVSVRLDEVLCVDEGVGADVVPVET